MIGILKDAWCWLFHQAHHTLYQIGYGGWYVRDCKKCHSRGYERR